MNSCFNVLEKLIFLNLNLLYMYFIVMVEYFFDFFKDCFI